MRDAINALSCWVHFMSIDTPALDHVSDGPCRDSQFVGGFLGGECLFCGHVGIIGKLGKLSRFGGEVVGDS